MAQESNIIIINQVLRDHRITCFADLADQPALFCKVFKEIFKLMWKALMSCSEEKIPGATLVVIKDDLLILTNELFNYYEIDDISLRYPYRRVDVLYSLDNLRTIIDAARKEIIVAISKKDVSSPIRTRCIQNCRNKIFEALNAIREFEHRRA
jgi:hypothetical protein